MFVRAKKQGGQVYYYLIQGFREGKRVRHKVIKYLGKESLSPEEIERLKEEFA